MKSIYVNYTYMAGSLATKTYSTSQYLVRFPLILIVSFNSACIDPVKLLMVSICIEYIYIVFTALCLDCAKESFVMFCDTACSFSLLEAKGSRVPIGCKSGLCGDNFD